MAFLNCNGCENCDYSIGLKYSNECTYMFGKRFLWLIRFLGNRNTVEIRVIKGFGLEKTAELSKVIFVCVDKERFFESINN